MIAIRFFRTRAEAEMASKVLKDAGFYTEIEEDKLYDVPIQNYNVPARFRLNILANDLARVSDFLAKKVKSKRLR